METSTLLRTPLHAAHTALHARIVPFAGYEMPVSYAGLTEEHLAVRNRAGMFDVSHMAEFELRGPDALALIQWMTTNDAARLEDGQVQYSCMPNGLGGIVDDLLVYRFHSEKWMLVVNASNHEKDWNWIMQQIESHPWDVQIFDRSADWALIAVQGPEAAGLVGQISDAPSPAQLAYYTFREGEVAGVPAIISATGYTGAGGVELYVPAEGAEAVWNALLELNIPPCGLGARDTLRMEAGFCLYGHEIDDSTSPIAAGLGWITRFTKDFVDRERFEREKAAGSPQILRGLKMLDRAIPRQGYPIVDREGNEIGRVTSGTMSPTLGMGIAMGYIDHAHAQLGNEVYVSIRQKNVAASVVKPGFLPTSR
jgi:aminomethyltransferase